jgi:hypothetical protein
LHEKGIYLGKKKVFPGSSPPHSMRLPILLFFFFGFFLAHGQPQETQCEIPTFSGPSLVEANQSYQLTLSAHRPDLINWRIDWGDGATSTEPALTKTCDHLYGKPGRYQVKVQAEITEGKLVEVARDYGALLQEDHPVVAESVNGQADSHAGTAAFLAALISNTPLRNPTPALGKIFETLVDQFTVEFWLRPDDLSSTQDLIDGAHEEGKPTRIYLENKALCLALPGGDTYIHPLGNLATGTWHHVAVTYDRAPTFPYNNVARFSIDGILAGEYHLDRYDTGTAGFSTASIGRALDGMHPLHGSIAGVAFYDRWLNPVRILDRVAEITAPGTQTLVVVPKNAETFGVEQPQIQTTINVELNPDPTADNGPVLRAAIESAAAGTRVRVLNATTHEPGGRFYFNSLASGQDWTALRFVGKTDFELDGAGANFVFRTVNRQFTVKQSKRIAFRNFSIDIDQDKFRVGSYARILDVDAASGTVRFQFIHGRDMTPDPTVPPSISMWRWRSHDPKTLRILDGAGMFFQTGEVFRGGMRRDPSDPSILIGQTTSAKMLEAFQKYRNGANFLMVNNADFRNTSVSLWDHCSQVTFDHVNFYGTLGMVFLSSEYDHMWITHCRIGLPPGETAADRPLASGADGFHFHENYGHTLFEDNEITLTDDDPISIKDGIWRNVTSSDPQTIHIKDFKVGEEIELYRNDLSPLDYTGTVTAASGGDITVDKPLPSDLPKTFLAQNHRERSFNWVLKDSYFHDYYGRFLVYTPWARITDNRITNSYLHIGTAGASFDDGGISSQVVVDNNILIDTNADTGLWGIDSTYPVFKNIAFVGNSFIHRGLSLNNSGNALVVGNYFENIVAKDKAAVKIGRSIAPQVIGNIQAGIGVTAFGLISGTTTDLQQEDNRAVAFPADMALKLPNP